MLCASFKPAPPPSPPHLSSPPSFAGASLSGGGGGGGGDVVALLGAFVEEALSPAQAHAFRFHAAFSAEREALQAHAFNARSANAVRAKLRNVLSSTTRARFLLSSGIVVDGPVGASTGQAGTVVLHALCGARALCAKVGPRAVVRREWAAMEAVHGRGARLAPTVACAQGCEDILSADAPDRAALLLPLYPLSLADALAALPAGPSRARDALSASAALCGLAAIAAFARAGWSHGDIKPANIMLSGASAACVLIDLGTARALGDFFSESSIFSLNEPFVASAGYDLVCLGATLAMLQLELFVEEGVTTRASLLEDVRHVAAKAVSPRAPAALVAEGALALGARAGVGIEDVRALAEAIASSAAALGAPALDDIWPRDA